MKWLRSLKPTNGLGSKSWKYRCEVKSIKGRECVHLRDHGQMHKAPSGYTWRSK